MNFDPSRCEIIDLSVPLQHDAPGEPIKPKIRYTGHRAGSWQMRFLFGIRKRHLRRSGGLGWALEKVKAITHTGTHVDAPWHYGPTSEGRPARKIDETPLDWFFALGVKLDLRHLEDGDEITVAEMEGALERSGAAIEAGTIVLIQTGADRRLGSGDYFRQPGLGRDGILWLVDQGVKVIGIDAYTLDRPFRAMKEDFRAGGDGDVIWPAHFAGLDREYCQIEKLAHLERIPADGFWVSCFPVRIEKASAAWCRAVAFVPIDREKANDPEPGS